jgi:predicted sulfurtransferase
MFVYVSMAGDCFVFDQRVSVKHGLEIGDFDLCRGCRRPLSQEQKLLEGFEEGEFLILSNCLPC